MLGDIRQTASFVVTTHLVDAECGYQYGWGSVHVHDSFELRLRLGELAGQTLLDPVERKRRQDEAEAAEHERKRLAEFAEADRLAALQESQNVPLLVLEAQNIGDGGNLSISIELLGRAQKLRPDNIEINELFNRFNERRRRDDWQDERKRDWERQQAQVAAAQEQQAALGRAAEEARVRAAQDAATRQATDTQLLEQQRQQAFLQLQAQAQLALQQQQFNQAVQLYQSALALRQTDEAFQGLAARGRGPTSPARLAAAQAAEQQQAALRQQRETELAQARLQLVEQRRNQEAKEQAERRPRRRATRPCINAYWTTPRLNSPRNNTTPPFPPCRPPGSCAGRTRWTGCWRSANRANAGDGAQEQSRRPRRSRRAGRGPRRRGCRVSGRGGGHR